MSNKIPQGLVFGLGCQSLANKKNWKSCSFSCYGKVMRTLIPNEVTIAFEGLFNKTTCSSSNHGLVFFFLSFFLIIAVGRVGGITVSCAALHHHHSCSSCLMVRVGPRSDEGFVSSKGLARSGLPVSVITWSARGDGVLHTSSNVRVPRYRPIPLSAAAAATTPTTEQ